MLLFSSFLLGFIAAEAKSCICPAAKMLAGASATLELLPPILPLAVYTTEKVNSGQSDRGKGGNRENRRGKNRFRRPHSATSEGT